MDFLIRYKKRIKSKLIIIILKIHILLKISIINKKTNKNFNKKTYKHIVVIKKMKKNHILLYLYQMFL